MAQLDSHGQERQELDWLRDEFISTLACELSTPLSLIKVFSDNLLSSPQDKPYQRQLLNHINEQAAHLVDVMGDWQETVHLEAEHRIALNLQPVETLELVQNLAIPV